MDLIVYLYLVNSRYLTINIANEVIIMTMNIWIIYLNVNIAFLDWALSSYHIQLIVVDFGNCLLC